jgi:hypothetical protein
VVGVLIVELHATDFTARKLARRDIRSDELEQLRRNGPIAVRNPHPRHRTSRLLIGPTDGGRLLTLVIEPDLADEAVWHVRTGWDASKRERKLYYQRG